MAMALGDIDLGASGLVLFNDAAGPVPDIGVIAGKNGKIYVLNLDNLGQFHAGSDIQIPQSIAGALGTTPDDQNYTTAVTWQDNFYFAGNSDVMKQYKLTNGQLTLHAQTPHVFGYTTASSVSSNGANDGIVWTMESGGDMLHAFDATNIAHELYNTKQAPGGRDGFGQGGPLGLRRPSSMAKSMSRAPPSLPYSGSCPSQDWLRVSAGVRCSLKRRNIQADPARVLDQNAFHHRLFPLMA